jgi:hypothetical protein
MDALEMSSASRLARQIRQADNAHDVLVILQKDKKMGASEFFSREKAQKTQRERTGKRMEAKREREGREIVRP